MNGGDPYELAKILGQLQHQDDRTLCQAGTSAYRPNQQHGVRDVETAGSTELRRRERCLRHCSRIVRATETVRFWKSLSALKDGGQGRT